MVKKYIFFNISALLFIVSIPMIIANSISGNIGLLSVACFLVWVAIMMAAISKDDKNILYILFLCTIFLFLMSRVLVRWIDNSEIYSPFKRDTMRHIYLVLITSLSGLWLGSLFDFDFSFSKPKFQESIMKLEDKVDIELLRFIVAPLTFFIGLCELLIVLEKLSFYQVGMGGEMRVGFSSSLPSIVIRISYLYIFLYLIYL